MLSINAIDYTFPSLLDMLYRLSIGQDGRHLICCLRRNMGVKRVRLLFDVKSIHYAWVTLGVAIAMRLVSSVERTASGVLVAYMVDPAGEFGWSRSVVGLALSLQWIFSGVFGPPAGWLGDRYGLRSTMAVGALLFLATSMLIGLITVPWQFLLYFGVLMSAALAVFQVPLITAVTMWFQKHLGVAMGLYSPPRAWRTCCLRR